jgi:hypothetical protein
MSVGAKDTLFALLRLRLVPPELADALGSLEVGKHQDVKQLGAGSRSGAERVQALPESALEFIRAHQVSAFAACSATAWTERSRIESRARCVPLGRPHLPLELLKGPDPELLRFCLDPVGQALVTRH